MYMYYKVSEATGTMYLFTRVNRELILQREQDHSPCTTERLPDSEIDTNNHRATRDSMVLFVSKMYACVRTTDHARRQAQTFGRA